MNWKEFIEMEFSKQERKIIKFILNKSKKKVKTIEIIFKDVFELILKTYYKNIGISMDKENFSIIIDKDNIKNKEECKEKIYELITLIKKLKDNKYILFEENSIPKIDKFYYSLINKKNKKDIPCQFIKSNEIEELLYNLKCDFFISSELRKLNRNFLGINFLLNNDQLNFGIAIFTTILSVLVAIVGFCIDYYIAKNISTTITFENNKQFEKLLTPKEINVKNENNIIVSESFYKPKTELKLEIFK